MTTAELHKMGLVVVGNLAVPAAKARAMQPAAPRQRKTIKAFVPAVVVSEANRKEHGVKKWSRAKAQKLAVCQAFGTGLLGMGKPRRVLLVLLSTQELDGDNLQRALKSVRDQIAASCGFNDREDVWEYRQRKPDEYETRGVWVRVEW